MSEQEIKAAIAEQEEYLKRITSCQGVFGVEHDYAQFATRPGSFYRQCWHCGVTETPADYVIKLGLED